MTVDATCSPPATEDRRPKGRRHLLGVAGRVMLEFPPQAESYTSVPQQQSDLESAGYQAFCCRPSGFILRSPHASRRAGSYSHLYGTGLLCPAFCL